MMKEAKEWADRVKEKLGQEKFNELAALILERRIEEANTKKVKEEIQAKFGVDIGTYFDATFIKY